MKSQEERIGEQATAAPSSGVNANQPQTAIPLVWFSQANINRFFNVATINCRFFPLSLRGTSLFVDGAGTKDNLVRLN